MASAIKIRRMQSQGIARTAHGTMPGHRLRKDGFSKGKPIYSRRLAKDYRKRLSGTALIPEQKVVVEAVIKTMRGKKYENSASFMKAVRENIITLSKDMQRKPGISNGAIVRAATFLREKGALV